MLSEFFTLMLSVLGTVFLLYYIIYRVLLWGERGGFFVIPLHPGAKNPGTRIHSLSVFCDFIGLARRSVIIAVDYGIEKNELSELKKDYDGSTHVFICKPEGLEKLIFEQGNRFN